MGEIRIRIFIQYSSSCFRSEEGAFSVKGKQWSKGWSEVPDPQLVRKYPLYFVHKQRILCHRPKFSTTLYWNGWLSMVPMSTSFRLQWMSKRSSTSTTSISTSTTTGHHPRPPSEKVLLSTNTARFFAFSIAGNLFTFVGIFHQYKHPSVQDIQNASPQAPPERILGMRASDIDKYSRVIFPITFLTFHMTYWSIFLTISGASFLLFSWMAFIFPGHTKT